MSIVKSHIGSLVGLYGHTFCLVRKDDPSSALVIKFQFSVARQVTETHYVVQFYDWVMGDRSHMELVNLDWFTSNNARFYEDHEDWNQQGQENSEIAQTVRERQRRKDAGEPEPLIRFVPLSDV